MHFPSCHGGSGEKNHPGGETGKSFQGDESDQGDYADSGYHGCKGGVGG